MYNWGYNPFIKNHISYISAWDMFFTYVHIFVPLNQTLSQPLSTILNTLIVFPYPLVNIQHNYGKIHHVQWENIHYFNGHFQ